jgi:hypothetical protein|tara:strand:- start:2916 stop:3215 length:300 start_codon:yes stop_codon:yes gene_type:complete
MMRERINRGDATFEAKLTELKKRFTGVKKSAESETAVNVNKQDLKDGYVTFWSDNSDITQLINRSAGYIVSVMDCGETVRIRMSRKGFRSCYHAFKLSK